MAEKRIRDMSRSDVHDILGGKSQIFKITGASGDVYQFRQFISGEKQAYRKSLKTRDLATALERAEKLTVQNLANVQKGVKLFGITLAEAIVRYLASREQDVQRNEDDLSGITKERLSTIKYQLNNLIKVLGTDKIKLSELERTSLNREERLYARERRRMSNSVTDITIVNEQSTINALIKWLFKEGLIHFEKFDFQRIRVNKNNIARRDTFEIDEYRRLTRFLVEYTKDKNSESEQDLYERKLVRECILILSNTMMRVGELWQLKFKDVRKITKEVDTNGTEMHLVTINVQAKTSKTRADRRIVVRGGDYFLRLKQIQKYQDGDDYVFTDNKTRKRFDRKKWYKHWENIMKALNINFKERNLTYYSLRHFAITERLKANTSVYMVAELAGTSIANISQFYGHATDEMKRKAVLKTEDRNAFNFSEAEKVEYNSI